MIIDQISEEVFKAHHEVKGTELEGKISIYLTYDFYGEIMRQIQGEVSRDAHEFYRSSDTICGYPVYFVYDVRSGINGEIRNPHPPYKIVKG